jgi:hypothetical protein
LFIHICRSFFYCLFVCLTKQDFFFRRNIKRFLKKMYFIDKYKIYLLKYGLVCSCVSLFFLCFFLIYVCSVSMDCCWFSDTATDVLVYTTESVENTSRF